jgi:hypothetical protein
MVSVLASGVVDHGFDNLIGGVMVSVLASSVVDHGFESWSVKIKDCKIGVYSAISWREQVNFQ